MQFNKLIRTLIMAFPGFGVIEMHAGNFMEDKVHLFFL